MNLELGKHNVKRGENHPRAKLTEKKVRLIRLYYKGGFTQVELAEMFGVKRCTISAIITRRSWRYLE